jgi:hypothetical protein
LPRRSKAELFRSPHRLPLETPQDVRREMSRLYRGGLNGRVPAGQLTKFVFVLDKIRGCLEAEAAVAAAAAAADNGQTGMVNIQLSSVPAGYSVAANGEFQPMPLVIEHAPQKPVPEMMQSDAQRRAELSAMPLERLLELAGVADVEQS